MLILLRLSIAVEMVILSLQHSTSECASRSHATAQGSLVLTAPSVPLVCYITTLEVIDYHNDYHHLVVYHHSTVAKLLVTRWLYRWLQLKVVIIVDSKVDSKITATKTRSQLAS